MSIRTVIKADQPWWWIDWQEIWEYRDLLWFLVLREFTAVYKQSILGPLWFIIQPLATTLVFTVIFGNIAKIGTDGLPPLLFYMSGMVMWSYFQGCMNGISTTLIQNVNLFGKVYFPRLTVPFALVLSNFGQFLLNLVVFLGFYFFYLFFSESFIRPNFFIFLLPLLVLQCAIVGLGVGLWLSALTVKYRDLRFALPFLSQLWLFATPIVYPASSVVQAKWRLLLAMNPMSGIVELNRYAFLGTGTTDGSFICVSMGSGILLLVTGLFLFNKIQRTFVDTI